MIGITGLLDCWSLALSCKSLALLDLTYDLLEVGDINNCPVSGDANDRLLSYIVDLDWFCNGSRNPKSMYDTGLAVIPDLKDKR